MSLENPKPTAASPVPELGRRALSPDRWAMLERHFDSVGPGKFAELGIRTMTIGQAIEVEGITFLPAVYYPA